MPSLRDQADAIQPRRRQRVTPLQLTESLPRDAGLARAATEPLVPDSPRVVPKAADAPRISGDSVVGEVSAQLRRQGPPLLQKGEVAVRAAPPSYHLQGSAEAVLGRLAFHRPGPLERPAPVMGEPQEVERAGALVAGARGAPGQSPWNGTS